MHGPRRTTPVLFLFLLLLGASVLTAAPDRQAIAAFEEWVAREMTTDPMPGLSVAFRQGETVWAKGFGFADLENRVPATAESSYRMASVTKPMTAVAALRLAEMGKLDLDAPIQTHVPYFPDKGKTITVRRLLAHLGGISHYRDYRKEGTIRDSKTTREAIAIFEDFDLVRDPGSGYTYSSYGYNLVGAALEAATGKPYGELMRELVWDPAGMHDTRMDVATAIIPNRVRGYTLDGGRLRNSDFVDISSRFAAGGIRSTVVDMLRFARAVDEGKLLPPETVETMWTAQTTTGGTIVNYGLGWSVHAVNGHFQVNHSGSQQETRTLLVHFPEEDLTIALASNYEQADLAKVRDRLYWHLTGEVWNPDAYVPDRTDRLAHRAASRAFDAGMFWFDRHGHPFTDDPAALRAAFAAFNRVARTMVRDPEAAEAWIEAGIDPVAGRPLLVAGSWMADRVVRSDPGSMERLHVMGELALFDAYVDLYHREGSIPRALRFERAFERRIERLADDWSRTWTPEARAAIADREAGAARLVALWAGSRASILPSIEDELVASMENDLRGGRVASALETGRLAVSIYPRAPRANGAWALALALSGNESEAVERLRISLAADPEGYASLRNLGNAITFLTNAEQWAALIPVAKVIAAVHPEDARPLVALGRAYRETGRAGEARAAIEQALRIEPDSKAALEELAKLDQVAM